MKDQRPTCGLCGTRWNVEDDLCILCRRYLREHGYTKSDQSAKLAEELGELRGLILHLASKVKEPQ